MVSGSSNCQIAYGFGRPVIATRVGSLSEVVHDGVNGRLAEPSNPQNLALDILKDLEPKTLIRFTMNANRTKVAFSREIMVEIVIN